MKETKEILRRKMVRGLQKVTQADRAKWSAQLAKNIEQLPEWHKAKHICIFAPLPSEFDTKILTDRHPEKVFSILKWQNDTFIPVALESWDDLIKNEWGVPEPRNFKETDISIIECVVLPALALSPDGVRLGRGMGFYDRFLEKTHATTIGAIFDFQIIEQIPSDPWDKPVDIIASEKQIIRTYAHGDGVR
jgi:5-formyltetrahydrofolate cyclo-ligase